MTAKINSANLVQLVCAKKKKKKKKKKHKIFIRILLDFNFEGITKVSIFLRCES